MTAYLDDTVRHAGRDWAEGETTCFTRRLIVWRAYDYRLEFEVHEKSAEESDGTPLFGDCMSPGPSKEPCASSLLWSGFVKWDGCTQWHPGEDAQPMHYDDAADVPDLRAIILQLWRLAAQHVPKWSESVTGLPGGEEDS